MSSTTPRTVIAGIGNPGFRYRKTYHNAGIMAAKHILGKLRETFPDAREKSRDVFSYVMFPACTVIISKTFMNESGAAVQAALSFLKAPSSSLILLHDDADLEIGDIRITEGGRSAGHNGVESVIRSLGTDQFRRARIGIRSPQHGGVPETDVPRKRAGDFVLARVSKEDQPSLQSAFEALTRKLIKNE